MIAAVEDRRSTREKVSTRREDRMVRKLDAWFALPLLERQWRSRVAHRRAGLCDPMFPVIAPDAPPERR